jgi:excinuclease ABC subunit A
MHFLGDVEIACEACNGKRFNDETLDIRFRGKNIYDVLELSVEEAISFFEGEEKVIRILDQLNKLDVGYLKLGQPSTTLSGGEAQRVKLASELYKTSRGHNLYILDEPSVGLHKADISYLLDALNAIVDNGNTVIVIEHDPDIIQQADHIIDLGPEGGQKGGYVVASGNLNDIINCEKSHTGKALKALGIEQKHLSNPQKRPSKASDIVFKGISTNNLKNIDVSIPLNKITVITGVSGSGKSSLAFDTIYAESRNRFTESLSSYARRMMSKVKKAELEQCSGLTPAIAIRQSPFQKNPRSTVGTATEIFDHYRLLFSRAGKLADGSFARMPASQFSFNNIDSACPTCKGLGILITTTPEQFISHPEKPLTDGALEGSLPGNYFGDPYGQFVNTLIEVGRQKNIDFSLPYNQLSEEAKNIALYGTGKAVYEVSWHFKRGNRTGTHKMKTTWKGFVNYINEEYEIKQGGKRGEAYEWIMSEISCPECHGKRFQKEVLEVYFNKMDIAGLSSMSIQGALEYFRHIHLENDILERSHSVIDQIISKLTTLDHMGLGYISIDRPTATLSGGEAQRLRIATQLVADLCGLTYVLDEPTTGLHPHDTRNLLNAIRQLKELGNTVIIVEHDPDIMTQADHIIDIGPGAGIYGGEIVGQGHISDILKQPNSITGKYLKAHTTKVTNKPKPLAKGIQISEALAHNLKNIDIDIPSGGMVTITGLSGSGKTSLAFDVIAKSFKAGKAVNCREISFENIDHLLVVNQQKIGTSPLSTAATYTGLFDLIRELFASSEAAKKDKLKKSHFSFNSKDGRCDTCKGMGQLKVSMDFLSDVWVNCDSCHGKRYKSNILEVRYKALSISDVLDLEISQALVFFKDQPKIYSILKVLDDIGLGYVTLGQATSTLSGGETQRLKLASHVIKEQAGKGLYIFDEPTTGLHMQDVERLLKVFRKLVGAGHSIIVVEHNLDVIRASDWIIDLGPEGGDKGGNLVFAGHPSKIVHCKKSLTGKALKDWQQH